MGFQYKNFTLSDADYSLETPDNWIEYSIITGIIVWQLCLWKNKCLDTVTWDVISHSPAVLYICILDTVE